MIIVLCLTLLGLVVGEQTFFEVDPDFKAMHRELLQVDATQQLDEPAEEASTIEDKYGPLRFFQQGMVSGKYNFLMTIKKPIQLSVFKDGKSWDTFSLDQEADGLITGSTGISQDELEVDIGWKQTQKFPGFKNKDKASIIMTKIKMTFKMGKREYFMKDLSASYKVDGQTGILTSKMKNMTKNGYSVLFPPTLSFTCYEPGLFEPTSKSNGYTAGLLFPGLQLQIGKVGEKQLGRGLFGPAWDCGVVFPIGLWVGLILSLFFAIICCWGFTMLANINTMDRFDDPKGKSINVPQSD